MRVFRLKAMEWAGALFGLLGAGLLAANTSVSGYGFVAYLGSNVCWLAYGIKTRTHGLVAMQLGFMLTTGAGLWRWFT